MTCCGFPIHRWITICIWSAFSLLPPGFGFRHPDPPPRIQFLKNIATIFFDYLKINLMLFHYVAGDYKFWRGKLPVMVPVINKGVLTSSKRWALYIGFINFSEMALVSWRIFDGSMWFQILCISYRSEISSEVVKHLYPTTCEISKLWSIYCVSYSSLKSVLVFFWPTRYISMRLDPGPMSVIGESMGSIHVE